ncbi:MAG: hypothetical protein PF961_19705 [Planctomycetota bacterium]|jgi:dihydrofolate synthase/folylpolyglutamate synthase|nr:hypothetical protein [Planctomycetota bacterium]
MRSFPTLASVDAWLAESFSREATGSYDDLKLGPLQEVLNRLPTPPAPVTIAGTKGKGSTLCLLESILLAHGRDTLAFTSPHVHSIAERWRINGAPADIAVLGPAVAAVADAEQQAGLTYFERSFAIAVVLAATRPEAIFFCEVGLGGRLDCANILDTRLAICTHLSRDHCHVLGDTVALIAREKLAIARPGAPLLIAIQSSEASAAVAAAIPPRVSATQVQRFPEQAGWTCGLAGNHQHDNLATALTAARILLGSDFNWKLARLGAEQARLAARCQCLLVANRAEVMIDGAHNGPSIAATLATAHERWGADFELIIGLATDKELDEILTVIPADCRVRRCGFRGPRARRETNWPGRAATWPWHDDIATALAATDQTRPCCITGSFYLAGEALALVAPSDRTPG